MAKAQCIEGESHIFPINSQGNLDRESFLQAINGVLQSLSLLGTLLVGGLYPLVSFKPQSTLRMLTLGSLRIGGILKFPNELINLTCEIAFEAFPSRLAWRHDAMVSDIVNSGKMQSECAVQTAAV